MTLLNLSMLLNINFCQKTQKYLLTPELITTLLDKILFHATINKKIRLIKRHYLLSGPARLLSL